MSAGIVLTCAPANWLRLLHARSVGKPVTFWAASRHDDGPPVGMVYIVAFSRLRFRAPMTPRRTDHLTPNDRGWPAGGRVLSIHGWHVEVDMAQAEGVTIEREMKLWPRWREVDWRGPPGPPRRGELPTVPADDEERPWAGWPFERMPKEIGEQAALIPGPRVRAVEAVAPAPVKSAGKTKSVAAEPVARGLFDGLI